MDKKTFLKIAKVKNLSEFYKLYPTEEDFLRIHRRELKKALLGEKIKKAQVGATQGGYNQMAAGTNAQAATEADVQGAISNLSTGTPKKTTGQSIAEGVSDIPILGSLVSGIVGLFDAGAERKRQVRAGKLSDLQLAASQSAPRAQNRKYVRPDMDANIADINSLMPAEGTGTNLLGKDGVSVPKADWGSILSAVLSSNKGGSGGGTGGLIGNILGSVLGGGQQQTTTPTTTQDPARFVTPNSLLSSTLGKPVVGSSRIIPVQNMQDGGTANGIIKNPVVANNIEQGAQATATGFSAIPGMNTKMAQSSKQIGETVGSLIPIPGAGPVLGLVGQAVGAIAEDKSGMKAMKRIERNTNQMASAQAARVLQSNNQAFMRTGGNLRQNSSDMEEDGNLKTLWGGHAESMSYNPYLPEGGETIMFRGKSHDESDERGRTGIGVRYGEGDDLQHYDANVEVEGGEPAVQLPDETGNDNLVVFGNLPIPKQFISKLGDPYAKGKKFKTYVAHLSKIENKQNDIINKAVSELEGFEPKTTLDKIKFDTLALNIKGADNKLKHIAEKKNNAAALQEAILDTAEEMNVDPESLTKGKIKAVKGAKIPKAQSGIKYMIQKNGRILPEIEISAKANKKTKDLESVHDRIFIDKMGRKISPVTPKEATFDYPENKSVVKKTAVLDKLNAPKIPMVKDRDFPKEMKKIKNPKPETKHRMFNEEPEIPEFFNPLNPYLPSNKEMLDPRQLTGEYFALATNQLEPVPAQLYHPDLKTPYEVSLQDILNENIATTRAAQRLTNNPAAQAMLAAQQYAANQRVLGDQFRINQELKDKVYSENVNTLNDAQLKNLAILDTQYQRQAKALSNTKDVAREALSSISDKYLQNQLQNRTLATYENLYNYRFDPNQHAWNMNSPAKWNMSGSGMGWGNMSEAERDEAIERQEWEEAKRKRRDEDKEKKRNGAILKAMKNL